MGRYKALIEFLVLHNPELSQPSVLSESNTYDLSGAFVIYTVNVYDNNVIEMLDSLNVRLKEGRFQLKHHFPEKSPPELVRNKIRKLRDNILSVVLYFTSRPLQKFPMILKSVYF